MRDGWWWGVVAGAALEVVGKAVQGWDALDCELREAAGLSALREGLGLRTAVQAIVDAVLDLLQDPSQLGCDPPFAPNRVLRACDRE